MIRFIAAVLFLVALAPPAAPAATCMGPNPAIGPVAVKSVTNDGGTSEYHLAGTVTNLGSVGQPSNTLQFVDIYVDRVKLDDRGIPPLAPGQSYTFGYTFVRSADAGNGTTTVHFRVRMVQGADCNPANGVNSVTF